MGSRDSLHEDKKSLPLPEVEPQPTCPACGLVNTELASYVCNCKQMINGQSGTEAKKKRKQLTSKKTVQIEKGTGQRTKTQAPIYLIPSSIFPRSLYKFQTMTPIFRSH